MIELNAVQFQPNKNAAINTLFQSPKTAAGWYKFTTGGIILYNMAGVRIGGINRNKCLYSSRMIDGKLWHNYADVCCIGPWSSYRERCEAIDRALDMWRASREVTA